MVNQIFTNYQILLSQIQYSLIQYIKQVGNIVLKLFSCKLSSNVTQTISNKSLIISGFIAADTHAVDHRVTRVQVGFIMGFNIQ